MWAVMSWEESAPTPNRTGSKLPIMCSPYPGTGIRSNVHALYRGCFWLLPLMGHWILRSWPFWQRCRSYLISLTQSTTGQSNRPWSGSPDFSMFIASFFWMSHWKQQIACAGMWFCTSRTDDCNQPFAVRCINDWQMSRALHAVDLK